MLLSNGGINASLANQSAINGGNSNQKFEGSESQSFKTRVFLKRYINEWKCAAASIENEINKCNKNFFQCLDDFDQKIFKIEQILSRK